MAKQKKQLTPLQQAYKKELQRIMRGVKKAEKQGYVFNENKLPKTPKRITKQSLSKLQKIKPKDLKAKAQKVDYNTGELISGKKALKLEKQQATAKAQETRKRNKELKTQEPTYEPEYDTNYYEDTDSYYEPEQEPEPKKTHYNAGSQEEYPKFSDMVISNFYVDISHFPEMAEPMLRSWISNLIDNYGKDDVAEMLESAKADGIWIDYTIAYSRDLLLGMISDMMAYLPDASEQFKKDLAEQFEYGEDWSSPD